MSLTIDKLCFSYPASSRVILDDISFSAGSGETIALLGPNGVGKSTLFRCILGFLKPSSGSILLDDEDVHTLSRTQFASKVAYIPQTVSPAFNYTIMDLVLMGVTSQLGTFESPRPEHKRRAEEILDSLGILWLANRGCGQVSGGERQLALLARAMIQSAGILIMDEPTANLDYGNQFRVMQRISALSEKGYTIIMSTHDPNQAFLHCSRVLAVKGGRLIADGSPDKALTADTIAELYNVDVAIRSVPYNGRDVTVSIPTGSR